MDIPQLFPDESKAGLDCGLGHACQFCPDEPNCSFNKTLHNKRLIEARLEEIGQIILVLANKGGVGKSTISANLAAGLAQMGFRVGVADADIHGPNQSRFFGHAGKKIRTNHNGLQCLEFENAGIEHPIRLGSLAFMLEEETTPIVWRDAYKHDFIHHLIGSFNWGSLDYLVLDMPPGTGNELITLCDLLEGSNASAVLVSSPQAVAQMDTLKAARYCMERGLPVIGAVENMAGVICPNCHEEFHLFPDAGLGEALAQMGVQKLATIPLAPEIAIGSDAGVPVICSHKDQAIGQAFLPMLEAVKLHGLDNFEDEVAASLEGLFEKNLEGEYLQEALAELSPEIREALGDEISNLLGEETKRMQKSTQRNGSN